MVFCAISIGVEIRCHRSGDSEIDQTKPLRFRLSGPVQTCPPPTQIMESFDTSNSMEEPPSKRLKIDATEELESAPDLSATLSAGTSDAAVDAPKETIHSILPPSHSLLGTAPPLQDESGAIIRLMESDVGISEYIAKNVPKINGIIKQRYALKLIPREVSLIVRRFTDFLVYEVDQDSNVVHIKSLGMPPPPEKKTKSVGETVSEVNADAPSGEPTAKEGTEAELGTETSPKVLDKAPGESSKQASSTEPWPASFTTRLSPFLSPEKIEDVKKMFLEGPEPPFVSDTGWSGRQAAKAKESDGSGSIDVEENAETRKEDGGRRGSSRRGRDRGGRGGRGGGRSVREDRRKVTSEVRTLLAHIINTAMTCTTAYYLEGNAHQLPSIHTRII
jgi:tRNA pseudouridine13 synthase